MANGQALAKIAAEATTNPVPAKRIVLTPHQETFCRLVVETGVPARAYRLAYPKSNDWLPSSVWVESSKLMAQPKVRQRIAQLMIAAGQTSEITVETLVVELDQARRGAMEDGKFSAAIRSTMAKAKITGHLQEESVRTGDIHIHFTKQDVNLL